MNKRTSEPEKLNTRSFNRAIKLLWPHRRYLIMGLICAVVMAVCYAGSIGGILPVLKVMVEREGVHGWVDRTLAEVRLDAVFSPPDGTPHPTADSSPVDRGALVLRVRKKSPLSPAGVAGGDLITALDGRPLPAPELLRRIAHWDEPGQLRLQVVTPGAEGDAARPITVSPNPLSRGWRLLRRVAEWLPRGDTPEQKVRVLITILAVIVCINIIGNVFRFCAEYLVSLATLRAIMDLRRIMYRKALRMPMTFFSQNVSDTTSRFVQDTQEVMRGLDTLFGKMAREPVKALFILILALSLDWRLTLAVIAIAPVTIASFWIIGRKVRKANTRLLRGYGHLLGNLEATLTGIAVVKGYTQENAERLRLWRIDRRMFRQHLKIEMLSALLSPLLESLGILGASAGIVWLGSRAIRGETSPSEFAAMVVILAALFDPLRKTASVYNKVQRAGAASDRIFSMLDSPDEANLLIGARDIREVQRQVELRDVVFRYPGASRPALDGASLIIERGRTLAVVGPNGAGKTTLINLLPRFFDPQEGAILFDGVDIRQATLQSVRRQISLVTQHAVIFATTVAENIAYGKRNCTEQEIIRAAERAYADEFVRAMPDGYETVVGEYGATLSGGQRQRIAIARAILRDAPILIFDEATSQIDSESEVKIRAAVTEFSRNRTTVIVAHRMSTIQAADVIAVMDQGKVIDCGTHAELLARCGLYHGLCETQFVRE